MKRNTRIVTLLKNYVNKQSKKVMASREDLQYRFDYLDWNDQKKILFAFLASCKSDREWAYVKLYSYWDISFQERITVLWEQYHEKQCSWLVVRYFPQEYVLVHLEELSEGRNYYFICLRMKDCENFKMDKSLLSVCDYLSVLLVRQESISDEECSSLLLLEMRRVFSAQCGCHMFSMERGRVPNASSFMEIYKLLVRLEHLGKKKFLENFEEWNTQIQSQIYRSAEFQKLNEAPLTDREYQQQRIAITIDYYRRAVLPENKDILQQMMRRHPLLNQLIDTLGLE